MPFISLKASPAYPPLPSAPAGWNRRSTSALAFPLKLSCPISLATMVFSTLLLRSLEKFLRRAGSGPQVAVDVVIGPCSGDDHGGLGPVDRPVGGRLDHVGDQAAAEESRSGWSSILWTRL